MRKTSAALVALAALLGVVLAGSPALAGAASVAAAASDPGPVPDACLPWVQPLQDEIAERRAAFESLLTAYNRDTGALNDKLSAALWTNQLLRDRVDFLRHDLRDDARIARHQRHVVRHQRHEIRQLRAELRAARATQG